MTLRVNDYKKRIQKNPNIPTGIEPVENKNIQQTTNSTRPAKIVN